VPIYEFFCPECQAKSSLLVKNIAASFAPECPTCGSKDLVRLISSFTYHKSVATIWEESGEPKQFSSPDYYKDPRNIGRWTEKRFTELGLDMPDQIKEEIQAAREGELPESVKEKL